MVKILIKKRLIRVAGSVLALQHAAGEPHAFMLCGFNFDEDTQEEL